MKYTDQFDWGRIPPATAVVEAVATVEEKNPDNLDSLYNKVDPDSLNKLVSSKPDSNVQICFRYGVYWVTLESNGTLVLCTDE